MEGCDMIFRILTQLTINLGNVQGDFGMDDQDESFKMWSLVIFVNS
jgi:hypothetical protein